jgi:hypothetical protein
MAVGLKVGDRVKVGGKNRLALLSRFDPMVLAYCEKEGTIVLVLPAEMDIPGKGYRIKFDDPGLRDLGFMGKELDRV